MVWHLLGCQMAPYFLTVNSEVYPFVYTFMTKRSKAMYEALLNTLVDKAVELYGIDLKPRNVSTDFERAAITAFNNVFPGVMVTGCHFHLGQSVLRKVNQLGLKSLYIADPEFALHVRMLYGMAYLPATEIIDALEIVRTTMPAAGQPVVDYFDKTYVNGPVIRTTTANENVHTPPMFPPNMWSVANRFESELPTSNHVEAWHRRLQTIIVTDHPSFYTCLHKLRQEQRHTELAIQRADEGFRPKPKRRSMSEHNRRLVSLMSDLQCGRKDTATFLRGVGHVFALASTCGMGWRMVATLRRV